MNNQELLIDHLDKKLRGESNPEAEALLQTDASAREDWQNLLASVDAVQHAALFEKVGAIRSEMRSTAAVQLEKPAMRSVTRNILRVAAALLFLVGIAVVYKLATVSNAGFYQEHYTTYQLPTTRSNAGSAAIETAYRNNNWNEVLSVYNAITTKTNKDHFLSGMALLELKQYTEAIGRFTTVTNSGDNYFQDESEFYLALAYIATAQTGEANTLLKKIKSDTGHLYQQKAADMLGIDLKILELK